MEIVDVTGKTLHTEQRFADQLGTLRAAMDLTGASAGNYILRVTTSDGQTTQNFVVE